jgi:hypothetical protein
MAAILALNIVLKINLLQHILSGATQRVAKSVPMPFPYPGLTRVPDQRMSSTRFYVLLNLNRSIPVHY